MGYFFKKINAKTVKRNNQMTSDPETQYMSKRSGCKRMISAKARETDKTENKDARVKERECQ